jgi:hypothetical protein
MLDDSLFVSDTIHEKEVELPDGKKHTLYFKELPAIEFRKFSKAELSEDEEVQSSSMARLVVASLCEPDGKPAITLAKAKKLKAGPMNAIISAIMEVNRGEEKNG